MSYKSILSFFVGMVLISFGSAFASTKEFNQKCLKCHSLKRAPKVLPTGEKMDLYVNPKRYNESAHGVLNCILCHPEINPSEHPQPMNITSKKSYVKQVNQNCLGCHEEIKKSFFHRNVIQANKVTCDVCHTAHYVKTMAQIKEQTKGCIKCHSLKRAPKVLADGEKMYLYVNPKEFAKTPHAKIGCFACHFDVYNSNRHPYPKKIKSKRAFAKEVVKNCIKCHTYASLSKHKGHAYILKTKRFLCIDCHGYHSLKTSIFRKHRSYKRHRVYKSRKK